MSSWLFFYTLFEWTIRLAMVPVILHRRFSPATSLAWLTLISFRPEVGLVIYLIAGGSRLGRARLRLHRAVAASMRNDQRLAYLHDNVVRPNVDTALTPVILQAQQITGMPILGGNRIELLPTSESTIDRLLADIEHAKHHVHLLYYIFEPDEVGTQVAEALRRAKERGVTCRLLADAVGSRRFFSWRHGSTLKQLRNYGVEVHPILPASLLRRKLARLDLRNHRKLAIIDGTIAYTGSQNIVNADYGHRKAGSWIDLSGRFTGPVVGQLQAAFYEDWGFETDEVLRSEDIFPVLKPTGDTPAQAVATGPTQEAVALVRVILTAINTAQRKIIITSPYLVPDESMILALSMAADRGVEVNLVVPYRSDHPIVSAAGRAHYDRLLEAGVHIYQHHRGMLHAKTITVDDALALLGSSNMDIRSFYLNFELNVLLYGSQMTNEVRFAQMQYLSEAVPVDRIKWQRRPKLHQFIDSLAALASPLL